MPIGTIQKYDVTKRSRGVIGISVTPALSGKTLYNLNNESIIVDSYGEYIITPAINVDVLVKMWGAAGGNLINTFGGGGGYSTGKIQLIANRQYKLIAGEAGSNFKVIAIPKSSGGGGGGSALLMSLDNSYIPLLVAGGGGGAGNRYNNGSGAGGGLTGESGINASGFYGFGGGEQTINLSINGTGGYADGVGGVISGGRGYGNGGAGTWTAAGNDDNPGGGGGGGYLGGLGGAKDGRSGGGGSGYINSSYVQDGITETGSRSTPANSSDYDRANAGGTIDGFSKDGRIIISLVE